MTFAPGDRVHLSGLGTGLVREARSGNRYCVEIKGRIVIADGRSLEPADPIRRPEPARGPEHPRTIERSAQERVVGAIDLHGKTVEEAVAAVEVAINDALVNRQAGLHIIHGRSGGRLKRAVHQYLRRLPAIATFRIDPQNPGVTVVWFA
jgi:DNA mismatch repair protein MutS2